MVINNLGAHEGRYVILVKTNDFSILGGANIVDDNTRPLIGSEISGGIAELKIWSFVGSDLGDFTLSGSPSNLAIGIFTTSAQGQTTLSEAVGGDYNVSITFTGGNGGTFDGSSL